jgi:hypothetical protein
MDGKKCHHREVMFVIPLLGSGIGINLSGFKLENFAEWTILQLGAECHPTKS